jgi:hypothetical protein
MKENNSMKITLILSLLMTVSAIAFADSDYTRAPDGTYVASADGTVSKAPDGSWHGGDNLHFTKTPDGAWHGEND